MTIPNQIFVVWFQHLRVRQMMITIDIEMWHMFIGIMIINVVQVFHSQNNNNWWCYKIRQLLSSSLWLILRKWWMAYDLSVQGKLVRPQSRLDELPASWTCWGYFRFPVMLQTTPPINGCGRQTQKNVTSLVVMEVTSESSELYNSRRGNCLKEALYKGSSTGR